MNIDRLPPHSIETEQALLGCLLLDPKAVLPLMRSSVGEADEFFYDLRHARIFAGMASLEDENKPVGLILLVERLRQDKHLDSVGGIQYLTALMDATPSAANAEYYLEILSEKATLRRLIQVATKAIASAYDSEGRSAEEIIAAAEIEILKVRRDKSKGNRSMKELVHSALDEIERLHQQQGAIGGMSTGLVDLDKETDGLHPGEMIVIAGYPGAGKSCLGMNIAEYQAVDCKVPVGVFSLEMTARKLVLRMLSSRARVNLRTIRDGFLAERDFPKLTGAADKLTKANIHICEISDLTISQLRAKARQLVQQFGIKLIVADYLQLLTAPGHKNQNREQEVAAISRGLKHMAVELDLPVIALCQLNDDGQARESRAIGQDADTFWRLEVATKNEDELNQNVIPVNVQIRKQRDGQAPAKVHLTFFKCFTRFETAARVVASDPNLIKKPYND